jgi:hypothetical protein
VSPLASNITYAQWRVGDIDTIMDTFPTPHQEITMDEDPPSPTTAAKKPKRFRMQGKSYTLTYAQCATKKEVAAERIEKQWGTELKGYIVSEELHKDGTPHLHAFIQFKEKKNFCTSDCFDFIAGQHGSYEVTKGIRNWVTYVTKDGKYVAKGVDVEAIKKKKAPKSDDVAKQLMEGKSLSEINKENPGYVMINKRKLEEYESWIRVESAKASKLDWVPPVVEGLTDTNKQIAQWIASNIRQPRKFKAPQLFITGKKNLGKTSLIEWLAQYLSVYHIPQTEDFYDLYSDDYDLVVFDEFKGQKTIQWMNLFLQGSAMNIRKKGSQYMKMKNLPVIILSNYTLGDCYPKANEDGRLETLRARLDEVEVDSFIDFYKSHEDLI